jgi:hypothetical protein
MVEPHQQPVTLDDLSRVLVWIAAIGQALVKQGVLPKEAIVTELERIKKAGGQPPEMIRDIDSMITTVKSWRKSTRAETRPPSPRPNHPLEALLRGHASDLVNCCLRLTVRQSLLVHLLFVHACIYGERQDRSQFAGSYPGRSAEALM